MSLLSTSSYVTKAEAQNHNLAVLYSLGPKNPPKATDFITSLACEAFKEMHQAKNPWYFHAAKLAINSAQITLPGALAWGLYLKFNYLELAGLFASVYVIKAFDLVPPLSIINDVVKSIFPYHKYEEEESKMIAHYRAIIEGSLKEAYDDMAELIDKPDAVDDNFLEKIAHLKKLLPEMRKALKYYGLSHLEILLSFDGAVRQYDRMSILSGEAFKEKNAKLILKLSPEQFIHRMYSPRTYEHLQLAKKWSFPFSSLPLIASAVTPFFASQYLTPDQLLLLQKGTFVCVALFVVELFYNLIEKSRHFRTANSDVQKIFTDIRAYFEENQSEKQNFLAKMDAISKALKSDGFNPIITN